MEADLDVVTEGLSKELGAFFLTGFKDLLINIAVNAVIGLRVTVVLPLRSFVVEGFVDISDSEAVLEDRNNSCVKGSEDVERC